MTPYLNLIFASLIIYPPKADTLITTAPWEPEDIVVSEAYLPLPPPHFGLGVAIGEKLIHWYQNRIASKSIHRCPYLISCSNYALRAVQERGLLVGSLYFIDRNLYRENPGIWQYYPLMETSDRGLKLDDTFYLTGPPQGPILLEGSSQIQGKGYAEELFRQGDYFRAITEFKRRIYLSPEDSTYCLLQIARAYRHSGKYQSAMAYASSVLERPDLTNQQNHDANLTLGLSYMGQRLSIMATQYFEAAQATDPHGISTVCLGWIQANRENWLGAEQIFRSVAEASEDSPIRRAVLQLVPLAEQGPLLPQKSPLFAVVLSGLVPGAGQFYSGHTYDGLQAFLLTTSFAIASYAMYKYENEPGRSLRMTYIGVGITGLFHAANMLGAYRTATYFNWRQRDNHLRKIRDFILPHTF
ncbi:MAG: membrane protein insertion efficiency factor YidD [Desulfobacteraceae bacterium]|nr:membrane protein insertion efficiency factor YidD [Desulfobacteraceae bacterium]